MRARVFGSKKQPRLNVSRSLRYIFAQLIDDEKGETLLSVHSKSLKANIKETGERKGKVAVAYLVGRELAKRALEAKIKRVVFDRGGNQYHGRVKAVAEGAREGGLEF